MIRAVYFRCHLPKAVADALNAESGRIYSQVLVEQYRIYRKKGVWLSPKAQERYNDYLNRETPKLLHAHSIDAAQQGFHEACKTTQAARKAGLDAKYPHKRKRFRTTVWKNTAIRLISVAERTLALNSLAGWFDPPEAGWRRSASSNQELVALSIPSAERTRPPPAVELTMSSSGGEIKGNVLLLSLARGQQPISLPLPEHLRALDASAFTEMRLVYNKSSRHYEWHLIVDDGIEVEPTIATNMAAIDLGEVHPATLTDGEEALVVMSRQLRSQSQHTAKNLASLQQKQSQHKRCSRRWKRLQQRKNRFLAKQELRRRNIEHKVSREVVNYAVERSIGKLFIGDVRDVADKTSKAETEANGRRYKGKVHNQRMSRWSHGKLRRYIQYKAQAAGIAVDDKVPEHYTSQTCPQCRNRYKLGGRNYKCPVCGFCSHRDVVGAPNILSRALYGELGKIRPPETVKYRQPYLRVRPGRSSPGHGACSSVSPAEQAREATQL